MWATYVTWAGAFLVGPNEAIRKLYPTLIVGTVSGVIFFTLAFTLDPIVGSVALTNSVLVFAMTLGLLYLARIPVFALVPGIFFGFTCYVGVALAAHVSTISALFVPGCMRPSHCSLVRPWHGSASRHTCRANLRPRFRGRGRSARRESVAARRWIANDAARVSADS